MRLIIIIFFSSIILSVKAQIVSIAATDVNGQALEGVTATFFIHDVVLSQVQTNTKGVLIKDIGASGTYILRLDYVGYSTIIDTITLSQESYEFSETYTMLSTTNLDPIEVTFISDQRQVGNVVTLSKRDFNVMPGSFDDPTRLLLKSPSISTVNDQANMVVYRSLPPSYTQWRLNNAVIVNPNHLSNAGTFLDSGTLSSGGVNAIGGQMLDRMTFVGTPNQQMFNSIGGVVNLESDKIDRYAQISLIGLEAGYNLSNFSLGYRYSFTGLLAGLGVDFGGEKIGFQDFNLRWKPNIGKGQLIISSTYGSSFNRFESQEDPFVERFEKVDYTANLLINTVNYKRKMLELTAAYSKRKDNIRANGLVDNYNFSEDIMCYFHPKFKLSDRIDIGIESTFDWTIDLQIMPYINYNTEVNGYKISLGYNPSYFNTVSQFRQNFSLNIDRKIQESKSIVFKYSKVDALQRLNFRDHLDPLIISHNFEFSFGWILADKHQISAQLFGHQYYNVMVSSNGFTRLDYFDYNIDKYAMVRFVRGRTNGFSINFNGDLFFGIESNINLSLLKTEVKLDNNWRATTESYGHLLNISIGKVWSLRDNSHFIRIGTSGHWRGSARRFPVEESFGDSFVFDMGPVDILRPYYRVDGRFTYQTPKWNLSLDIQNITNRRNDGYTYYNYIERTIKGKKQLGLLPVLSYKYKFGNDDQNKLSL